MCALAWFDDGEPFPTKNMVAVLGDGDFPGCGNAGRADRSQSIISKLRARIEDRRNEHVASDAAQSVQLNMHRRELQVQAPINAGQVFCYISYWAARVPVDGVRETLAAALVRVLPGRILLPLAIILLVCEMSQDAIARLESCARMPEHVESAAARVAGSAIKGLTCRENTYA